MKKILLQIISAIAGLWLSTILIQGVSLRSYPTSIFFGFSLTENWHVFIVIGIILGLLNYFLINFLKSLSLPLEKIFNEFFAITIGMGFLWFVNLIFEEITILTSLSILYTTLIIWLLNIILNIILNKKY